MPLTTVPPKRASFVLHCQICRKVIREKAENIPVDRKCTKICRREFFAHRDCYFKKIGASYQKPTCPRCGVKEPIVLESLSLKKWNHRTNRFAGVGIAYQAVALYTGYSIYSQYSDSLSEEYGWVDWTGGQLKYLAKMVVFGMTQSLAGASYRTVAERAKIVGGKVFCFGKRHHRD